MKIKNKKVIVIVFMVVIAVFMKIGIDYFNDNHLESDFFKNVYIIEGNYTSENGVVEKKFDHEKTQKLIDVIYKLDLEEIKNNKEKGWQILLKCYDQEHNYMYNVSVLNNILQIKDKTYRLENEAIEQIEKIIMK